MSVVSAGREEAVDLLLGTEIDVNAKNSSGQTALHYAVLLNYTLHRSALIRQRHMQGLGLPRA